MVANEQKVKSLPTFANEQAEAELWDTYDSTNYLAATEAMEMTFVDAQQ